jgi:hypothetical protein
MLHSTPTTCSLFTRYDSFYQHPLWLIDDSYNTTTFQPQPRKYMYQQYPWKPIGATKVINMTRRHKGSAAKSFEIPLNVLVWIPICSDQQSKIPISHWNQIEKYRHFSQLLPGLAVFRVSVLSNTVKLFYLFQVSICQNERRNETNPAQRSVK